MAEISQNEYVTHFENKLSLLRKKIISESESADYLKMQGYINDVNHIKQKIAFAKSGKMHSYFI